MHTLAKEVTEGVENPPSTFPQVSSLLLDRRVFLEARRAPPVQLLGAYSSPPPGFPSAGEHKTQTHAGLQPSGLNLKPGFRNL